MRRNFRRSFRRGPRPAYHWARATFQVTVANGASTTQDLLTVADYASNTSLSPTGVTIVRTIVEMAVVSCTPQAAHDLSDLQWGIFVIDEDQSALAITTANLRDERVLAVGCAGLLLGGTTLGPGTAELPHWSVDSKQRFRLKNDEVRLVFTETGADASFLVRVQSSILLKGDTT